MTYTVKLDFDIDTNEVMTDEEVEEFVREIFNYTYCSAYNVEVLNVNKEFENELI